MKLLARICFGLGVTVGVVGLGVVLTAVADAAWAQRPLFRGMAEPGVTIASPWRRIGAPAARVGMGLTVAPHNPRREQHAFSYSFPLHYRVRDDSGQLLIDRWVLVDAGQDAVFDAFPVERGKRVRVEAMLLPDQRHQARLEQAELRLYRQPAPATVPLRLGVAGLLAGLVLLLLGLMAELSRPLPQPGYRPARILVFPLARRQAAPLPAAEDARQAL